MSFLAAKEKVLRLAAEQGFALAGVAPVPCEVPAGRLGEFLRKGYHADMEWLARQGVGRLDVRSIAPWAQSVICLAASYAPAADDVPTPHVALYARGRDYHRLLRKRCEKIVAALRADFPQVQAKICVDSAPVSDRSLAAAAGLGWIGRNGCLIHPRYGSYLLLAEIITDLPLPPDAPVASACGDCRRCVDACPGRAIVADGLVDCRRCNSYLTIEHRGEIPPDRRAQLGRRIFGCDACQAVCPFNSAPPPGLPEFRTPSPLAAMPLASLLGLTLDQWERLSPGTPLRRAGLARLLRNATIALENTSQPQ